ncbi:MAG: hypothetical protein VXW22_13620, partial [Pseudomonadota bacterium]|nr:hypothetical protein [Pseudomonadota bacterium]
MRQPAATLDAFYKSRLGQAAARLMGVRAASLSLCMRLRGSMSDSDAWLDVWLAGHTLRSTLGYWYA